MNLKGLTLYLDGFDQVTCVNNSGFFLWQTSEQPETKKRKASVKEDGKKLKKPKTGKEKGDGLTLNAATKCVEILHIKVMRYVRKHHMKIYIYKVNVLTPPSACKCAWTNIAVALAVTSSLDAVTTRSWLCAYTETLRSTPLITLLC